MPSVDVDALAERARPLVDALHRWGERELRDLPWRHTRDPWAILVSELMAQQTQVARVVPRWEAFLADFPDAVACAAAPVGAIVRAWEGLGYNRRAVHLHATATAIVERHGGVPPDDLDALLALPGIGPYTARAVLAFAHERDVGVLDTNVARVLARAVAGERLAPTPAQRLADALVPAGAGWLHDQAMMDLGATVCTKRSPRCDACPLVAHCAWAGRDHAGPDPADGSAGTGGRQSRFDGSDRQGRGRIVAALRTGPVELDRLTEVTGWEDHGRARRAADSLVADGLAEYVDGVLVLPA